ncbi:hypothetical protein Sjap_001853 [Stephania japonica]|uniref:Uncharacterized protein n=1 Tax=Stephania japonica TaxID=461633 RepID=A0AAP0PRX3_9MAGN
MMFVIAKGVKDFFQCYATSIGFEVVVEGMVDSNGENGGDDGASNEEDEDGPTRLTGPARLGGIGSGVRAGPGRAAPDSRVVEFGAVTVFIVYAAIKELEDRFLAMIDVKEGKNGESSTAGQNTIKRYELTMTHSHHLPNNLHVKANVGGMRHVLLRISTFRLLNKSCQLGNLRLHFYSIRLDKINLGLHFYFMRLDKLFYAINMSVQQVVIESLSAIEFSLYPSDLVVHVLPQLN